MTAALEADPTDVGLDPDRLRRIDTHFRRYIDDGRLPGYQVLVARRGKIAFLSGYGYRDRENELPVEADTVYRIYSMTKAITSVALMMLWEEGAFQLHDPVARFLPAFAETPVWHGGSSVKPQLVAQAAPMEIGHLFTHTSGLTYGFHHVHPTDELYRKAGYELGAPRGATLADACDTWATLPLRFQPGTRWNYSVATDVLGRLVEVISGQPLDEFFRTRLFDPLAMSETSFDAVGRTDRLAALYIPDGTTKPAVRFDPIGKQVTRPATFLSGGGGLVSTIGDYHRFLRCLLNGGELDGARVLGPRTLDLMGRNHLPGGVDMAAIAEDGMTELARVGMGFGLGFAVTLDPGRSQQASSVGDLSWGGAASTGFWFDRAEDLDVVFMTQLLPSSTHPLRPELRSLVYQAITD
jgi:CubicO group peptidase (beta-lactamase class C family)